MKSKKIILGLILLTTNIAYSQHTSQRKIFATDIVNKSGTATFYFPTTLPTANRVCEYNSNREATSSSVTSTELGYLSGVTSAIQTQLNAKASTSNFTGDSGSGGVAGLVPAPAAGDAAASKFLKADGTWAAAGGGGSSSLTSTYVGYGDGSNALTGSSDFVYDATNKSLRLNQAAASTGPRLLHYTHGTQTGTTSTDGVVMGYPTANSSNFRFTYQETGNFDFYYGSVAAISMTSSAMGLRAPNLSFNNIDLGNSIYLTANTGGAIYTDSHFIPEVAIGLRATAVSGNDTLTVNSNPAHVVSASGGNRTITTASNSTNSPITNFIVKNRDATNNVVTIAPNGATPMNGLNENITMDSMLDSVFFTSNANGNWLLSDSRAPKMLSITSNTTLSADLRKEMTVLCDATSGNVTLTGYASVGRKGWRVTLKKIDSSGNTCTYDANSSETIDGATTSAISTQWAGKVYQADGTNHVIVGSF